MEYKNKLLIGDSKKIIDSLPEKIVNTIVTSVPYWGLRDYGVKGQMGMEDTPEEYIYNMTEVFKSAKRVLRDDGTLWLNIGDGYWGGKGKSGQESKASLEKRHAAGTSLNKGHQNTNVAMRPQDRRHPFIKAKDKIGIPWALAFALRDGSGNARECAAINKAIARIKNCFGPDDRMPRKLLTEVINLEYEYHLAKGDGWYFRQDNIWSKTNCAPESCTDRPTTAHEYFFLFSKNKKYYYDYEAVKEQSSDKTNSRISKEKLASIRNGTANGNNVSTGKQAEYIKTGHGIRAKNNTDFNNSMTEIFETRNKRSVWECPTNSPEHQKLDIEHFAVYPEDLIITPIKAGCPEGGIVMDIFGGTGTTGVVSKKLHRDYLLIDINPQSEIDFNKYLHQEFGMFK